MERIRSNILAFRTLIMNLTQLDLLPLITLWLLFVKNHNGPCSDFPRTPKFDSFFSRNMWFSQSNALLKSRHIASLLKQSPYGLRISSKWWTISFTGQPMLVRTQSHTHTHITMILLRESKIQWITCWLYNITVNYNNSNQIICSYINLCLCP